jgi:hypothetical protein
MKRFKTLQRTLALTAAACLLCFTIAQAKKPVRPPREAAYTIVPFMPPDVTTISSGVADLNEQGHAVGWEEFPNGDVQALHFNMETSAYTTLSGGAATGAEGVNNLNQIVGSNGDFGAFWDSPTNGPILLLPLDPTDDPQSVRVVFWATDINDDGVVIGASMESFGFENEDGTTSITSTLLTGVVWRVVVDNAGVAHVDGPLPLLPLNGHIESFAGCLNELAGGSAQVTGYSSGPREAVLWTIDLNPEDGTLALPGPPVSLIPLRSQGAGINNFGDVCGQSDSRPFVALAGQDPQTLPVPRNTQDGYADDINDMGEIVGQLDIHKNKGGAIGPPRWHAYLWSNGEPIDLHKQIDQNSGWDKLKWANTINNAGVIGGWGSLDVDRRGFLLIPNQP